jgi:hypothetical protein
MTKKKARKVIQKKKRSKQGEAQPIATLERHTPGPLADDVPFLIRFLNSCLIPVPSSLVLFYLLIPQPSVKSCMDIAMQIIGFCTQADEL